MLVSKIKIIDRLTIIQILQLLVFKLDMNNLIK